MRLRVVTLVVALALAASGCLFRPGHPAGWKAVDSRGIRIFVPRSWPVVKDADLSCGYGRRYRAPAVLLATTATRDALCLVNDARIPLRRADAFVVLEGPVDPAGKDLRGWNRREIHDLLVKTKDRRLSDSRLGMTTIFVRARVALSINSVDEHLVRLITSTARSSPK